MIKYEDLTLNLCFPHFLIITNCHLSLAFFKSEIVEENINLICNHYVFQKKSLEWNLVSKINPNHHLKNLNLLLGNQNLPCMIISISRNYVCEPLIKQWVLPKNASIHWYIDVHIQNKNILSWSFQYMTLWNVWCKELHMKVPQVHDLLKCFANLKKCII